MYFPASRMRSSPFVRENHDPQAQQMTAWKCPLGDSESPTGFLILLHQKDGRLPLEARVSVELANGFIVTLGIRDQGSEAANPCGKNPGACGLVELLEDTHAAFTQSAASFRFLLSINPCAPSG